MKLFLSHRIDSLVEMLDSHLREDGRFFLKEKVILAPNEHMKGWLMLELAKRQGVAMGLKIQTPQEWILSQNASPLFSPNSIEMFCLIYDAISKSTDPDLRVYLENNSRRILDLTEQLAPLFFSYGQFGEPLFDKHRMPIDWQHSILQDLFIKGPWRSFAQILPNLKTDVDPIYCFAIDFLPVQFWQYLIRFPALIVYQFSPCGHFWSDIQTDRERIRLNRFWKKHGKTEAARNELDSYLQDTPSILRNWGKLGREAVKTFDEFDFEVNEVYPAIPDSSLLACLQMDLLSLSCSEKKKDGSIRIVGTGNSRLKEVEYLRDCILQMGDRFRLDEISVLAPDVSKYSSLIEFVFADKIPYRIFGSSGLQDGYLLGLNRLIALKEGRWETKQILELFETPAFHRKRGWNINKVNRFRVWIEEANIEWGFDALHKSEVLAETIGKTTVSDRGTWEKGLERILETMVFLTPDSNITIHPDDFEELWTVLTEMRSRLKALQGEKTLCSWAESLDILAQEYLDGDASLWKQFVNDLRKAESRLEGALFPFACVQKLLSKPSSININANHLHAVRFASIEEGALIPSKALFLIGMDEESFPRFKIHSSLDLLKKEGLAIPDVSDRDRYFFLQAILSASEYLQISYGHLSADEGKPVSPSIVVQELISYLKEVETVAIPLEISSTGQKGSFWPKHCPKLEMPEGEQVVFIEDLKQLAGHPWRFYLRKVLSVFLSEKREDSLDRQKNRILRSTLDQPIEKLRAVAEEEMPAGVIGEAVIQDILEKGMEWRGLISQWEGPFTIALLENCTTAHWDGPKKWIAPAIQLKWEGCTIKLVGEIKPVSSGGFLCLDDDKIEGLLRAWPECLAAAVVLNLPSVVMVKSGKVKTVENAEDQLKAFMEYYFRCLKSPSPLISSWADSFLRKGVAELEKKMEQWEMFEDPVKEWVMARTEIPSAETLFSEWGECLKTSFAGLISLYPTRKKGEVDAAL